MLEQLVHRSGSLYEKYVLRVPRRSDAPYTTHLPVLIMLGQVRRIERILEFGSGEYSTLAFTDKRIFPYLEALDSYENDETWAEKMRVRLAGNERVRVRYCAARMSDVAECIELDGYQLIFVDDSESWEERTKTIEVITSKEPMATVVIHDYEVKQYRKAAEGFRLKHRFAALTPNTGVLSNERQFSRGPFRRLAKAIREDPAARSITQVDGWYRWIRGKEERL